ncbi:MAG: hypothetical protein ACPG5P_05725 [Saprospiraceae bacterium]
MKNRFLPSLILVLSLAFVLPSCFSDSSSKALTGEDLVGEWKVKSATRGGKKTALLDGFYFNFKDKESLTSNFGLDGKERNYSCKLKDGKLLCKGDELLELNVEQEMEGEMVFSTKLAGKKFRITVEHSTSEE